MIFHILELILENKMSEAKKFFETLNMIGSLTLAVSVPWIIFKVFRAVYLKKCYNGLAGKFVMAEQLNDIRDEVVVGEDEVVVGEGEAVAGPALELVENVAVGSIFKHQQGKPFSQEEKTLAYNIFASHSNKGASKSESVKLTSSDIGVSKRTIWTIVTEQERIGVFFVTSEEKAPPEGL
ncbi:hypothetical protein NQ314_005420 [Rhamnusium bicolor]|uniref:Uncharacterized protein n=1 Tax=Rhamnusium bicolor TaxID=1586634 RepID=A0AAV8ZIV8_9CUCU|nr:hypothetical protein NQ314_005420 [Rhamnusium bicolor]